MIAYTVTVVLITIFAVVIAIKTLRWVASWMAGDGWKDDLSCWAYNMCSKLGLATPEFEILDHEGLDRYPEDGSNPFVPFVTKIVVPNEYARQQVSQALSYLHNLSCIDTDYMAVNFLTHLNTNFNGEVEEDPKMIVIENRE